MSAEIIGIPDGPIWTFCPASTKHILFTGDVKSSAGPTRPNTYRLVLWGHDRLGDGTSVGDDSDLSVLVGWGDCC